MTSITFLVIWIVLNIIGFTSGSYLGATSVGILPKLLPGTVGILLGDLLFGTIIGFFQWLALKRFQGFKVSSWWIGLFCFGFTFGARAGSLLTYRIVNDWLAPSFVFGVFMGGCTGLAVVPLLWGRVSPSRLVVWVLVSIIAWILGETIAFSTGFVQSAVPWVALTISTIKGGSLLWLGRKVHT